jgi:hypothetical protein
MQGASLFPFPVLLVRLALEHMLALPALQTMKIEPQDHQQLALQALAAS